MSLATSSLGTMSLATMSLATMSLTTIVHGDNCSTRQLFHETIIPPFFYKWSFTKRMVLRMTKIKEMEEHGWLQMIIRIIWPPSCSSVPLQMDFQKGQFFG